LKYCEYIFFALALFFACWSVGRLSSAMNNGLRYARTLQFTLILLALGVPIPFLSIADPSGLTTNDPSIWDLYVLRPLFGSGDKAVLAVVFGIILLVIGFLVGIWSESLAKARYSRMGLSYGQA
jgi:hypothetical protein